MNVFKLPTVAALLLLLALIVTTSAQQKRQSAPKPQSKPAPAPTPTPTFDTLLPAECYIFYGEVRGPGQVIRSSALNDLLEPVLKLSAPPKEFKTIVKWLDAHADEVMTSRLLVAAAPIAGFGDPPQSIVAIEFASAEEATKFAGTLDEFLPTILPPPAPESSPKTSEGPNKTSAKSTPTDPPLPGFHLRRLGSLVVITPKPWTMKQLRPAGSKLLAEDTNFRAARNRFNSEPIFAYVDAKLIEREEEQNRKKAEEFRQREIEEAKRVEAEAPAEEKKAEDPEEPGVMTLQEKVVGTGPEGTLKAQPPVEGNRETAPPDLLSSAMNALTYAFFSAGETDWPDAVGLALSFEGDSFDLRALLVTQAGEKSDAIPGMPMLITGASFTPEAPDIFPADTEILVTMSLDLPQIYAAVSKPPSRQQYIKSEGNKATVQVNEPVSPIIELEQKLKIKLKDDLLPLLGSEVAIGLPLKGMNIFGLPGIKAAPSEGKEESNPAPVLAIALRDRESMRALMPKLIENLGFKGASPLAQSERREDTEIVSYLNTFAYAFIGNFLVLSSDAATLRRVVASYLKHETLAAENQFRNSTRWQPRPLYGQLYISPALMESYRTWAQSPSAQVSDSLRAFLTRATEVAQPITYSLSNEGLGPLHEVHIPKNLLLMAVAGISGAVNPSPLVQNERNAIGIMHMIAGAESQYKISKGNGSYGTLEQLIAVGLVTKESVENSSYKFEVFLTGDKFEVSAVPIEYGKSGKLSLWMDQTHVVRGGDKNGASATGSDPPIN